MGQLNGNGQKGMLQIDAPPVENFRLRHWPCTLEFANCSSVQLSCCEQAFNGRKGCTTSLRRLERDTWRGVVVTEMTMGQRVTGQVKKVKFSHTRYRALGPELIPVYRQSARR